METSVEDFHSRLIERVLDILWSQWSAVGTYANVPPYETAVIDPEALICATMWFGRYSPRLFDEAMDWLCINNAFISLDRLKSISKLFTGDTRATLGASLEYLWKVEGKAKFRGKSSMWEKERLKRKEALFRSWPEKGEPAGRKGDEVFLKWGFDRGRVELRGMSSGPPLGNPANLRFVLRDLFGLGVRAEVATYLILVGRGNSTMVAKAVTQNQRAVYAVLDDFARGGFAHKREAGRETVFAVETQRWSRFIELKEKAGFIQWANVFSALQEILVDRLTNEKAYGSRYLASSRLREISPRITKMLAEGGVISSIPDPRKHPGEKYNDAFLSYIDRAINGLIAHG